MNEILKKVKQRNEREDLVHCLRKKGLIFREIGEKIGVSPEQARQMFDARKRILEKHPSWMRDLGPRITSTLNRHNIKTKEEAKNWLLSAEYLNVRNFGDKSATTLAIYLGLPQRKVEDKEIQKYAKLEKKIRTKQAMIDTLKLEIEKLKSESISMLNLPP